MIDFMDFMENYNDIKISDDDTMFETAFEILTEHMTSGEKLFNIKNILEPKRNNEFNQLLDMYDYDVALVTVSEIFSTIKYYDRIFFFGSSNPEKYITSEELIFDKYGMRYLLNALINLKNSPADSRYIFAEFTEGLEDKDPYFIKVLDMYIEILEKDISNIQ